MAKPKTQGHRRGGRNRQFFTGLSGLARGLDAVILRNRPQPTRASWDDMVAGQKDKLSAAEAKRERRRLRNLQKGD